MSGVPSVAAASAFVSNAYETLLNREPTAAELHSRVNRIEHGASEASIVQNLLRSSKAGNTKLTPFNNPNPTPPGVVVNSYADTDIYSNYIGGSLGLKAFVDGLYLNVFHSVPDPAGETYYTNLLETGQARPSKVVTYFEHNASMAGISFDTPPTPHPSNIYTGYLGGTIGVKSFVDGLYENVYFRAPDPQGEAYWVDQIEHHQVLPAKVTFAFLNSAEFVASGATVTSS